MRFPNVFLRASIPLAVFALLLGAGAGAAEAPGGVAFYAPPSPLPSGTDGSVIWSRPLTTAAALPSAARNVLVLYRVTSVDGRAAAVSGTIAFPHGSAPPGGWPVVSWAHGTTGNAPQCAPSRADQADDEQRMLDHWVARGYVVAETDYEGVGTPGIHPYFVGEAAAHDVIDIVRAARELDPGVGARFVAMGHSEGGTAALFTAAVAPYYAPDLRLIGTVPLAPASHLMQVLRFDAGSADPDAFFPFTLMLVEGIASVDSAIDLGNVLSPLGLARLPDLAKSCIDELVDDPSWTKVPARAYFRDSQAIAGLISDFVKNEPSTLQFTVPVLMLEGAADKMVTPKSAASVAESLCKRGAGVEYDTFAGAGHGGVIGASLAVAERWVDARFAGSPPHPNCT